MIALTTAASAKPVTANDVLPGCKAYVDRRGSGFDLGYCAGYVDALLIAEPDVCWEGAITNEQAVRVVIKYIEARPSPSRRY